jgi:hypothetical protein
MTIDAAIIDSPDETVDIGKTMQLLEAYIKYFHGSKASIGLCQLRLTSNSGFVPSWRFGLMRQEYLPGAYYTFQSP